jgi:hypothetical protein
VQRAVVVIGWQFWLRGCVRKGVEGGIRVHGGNQSAIVKGRRAVIVHISGGTARAREERTSHLSAHANSLFLQTEEGMTIMLIAAYPRCTLCPIAKGQGTINEFNPQNLPPSFFVNALPARGKIENKRFDAAAREGRSIMSSSTTAHQRRQKWPFGAGTRHSHDLT